MLTWHYTTVYTSFTPKVCCRQLAHWSMYTLSSIARWKRGNSWYLHAWLVSPIIWAPLLSRRLPGTTTARSGKGRQQPLYTPQHVPGEHPVGRAYSVQDESLMISSRLNIYNDSLDRCGNIRCADNSPGAPKRCCLTNPWFSAKGLTLAKRQAETTA